MSVRLFYIFMFLTVWTSAVAQVNVRCELDDNKMLIGDQRTVRITLESRQALTNFQLDISEIDSTGKIEILREEAWSDSIPNQYFKEWVITCFDSGYYQLLPIEITYESNSGFGRIFSPQLALMVDNPPIDSSGIAPIKDIISEPKTIEDYFFWIYLLVGICTVGFLIWYFFIRTKPLENATPVIVEIKKPAHEIALSKLDDLAKKQYWQKGEVKKYYSGLTFIIREYLEERYGIRALEQTTSEITAALKSEQFDHDLQSKLRDLLQSADIVKFAKGEPAIDLHLSFWKDAQDFVLQTKRVDAE